MPGSYFLMKSAIEVSAQELTPKEKSLHYLSNSACGATDPLHMICCSLCLRVSREINNLLHLMLSDSSGSDGPPEADVKPNEHDEKHWNPDSLWYMSLGEHGADLQSTITLGVDQVVLEAVMQRKAGQQSLGRRGVGFSATKWCHES